MTTIPSDWGSDAAVPLRRQWSAAGRRGVTLGLFFVSGFTGLVYEVLWMKELGLLFGSTAWAASTALAAFFLGLAGGSYVWGNRAASVQRPLRAYGVLEGCVALSALLYFLLLDAYHAIYAPLFQIFGPQHTLFVAVKFVLAVGVLFPPAFFMGGTLPLMSQYLVRHPDTLGRTTSVLYAVNTCGAALGAFIAGFYLPPLLGFTGSYLLAIGLTGSVALVAWWADRTSAEPHPVVAEASSSMQPASAPWLSLRAIQWLAFLSGFVTLSLEVLWTRMFAQVLQNSVYTFTVILVTFLIGLSAGAGVARGLMRWRAQPLAVLCGLLLISACLVGLSPFVFSWLTNGLSYLGSRADWGRYILRVFWCAGVIMGVPCVFLGSILPFLLKMAQPFTASTGRTVGKVVSANMIGAIAGSLCAGFVFLPFFGLWTSIRLVAAIYFVVILLIAPMTEGRRFLYRFAPVGGLLMLLSVLDTARLPRVKLQPVKRNESLYTVWEGSTATVAVIKRRQALKLKVNNFYTVGGTGSVTFEERQAQLPLTIHAQPRTVFFLGMGTGITAGAALAYPVEGIVVCELIPEVVQAARTYFQPYINGLFDDARATVVVEDGRNYLLGTRQRFDVIIGDLFLPWRSGVGSLYTREHFVAARERLQAGGLFTQWLPLYQMSKEEFAIIVRTTLEVFPLVTLWRGDFLATRPVVGLVGHREATPFEPHELLRADSIPFMAHYAGNLTASRQLFADSPLNTDDRPLIEYRAPITHRRQKAKATTWFIGTELIELMVALQQTVPPERDPYLQRLPERELQFVRAGLSLHWAGVLKKAGDMAAAEEELKRYKRSVAGY